MKTDAELKQDVMAELAWDPAVKSTDIGVIVKDGIVTLTGHLATFAEKRAAERAVQRVRGVTAIAIEMDVTPAAVHKRSDTEVAAAIERALAWQSQVPAERVQVTVEKGWVTLRGDLDWDFQRRSVEKMVRALIGVVGISNLVTIKPQTRPTDVARNIENALKRQALREAQRIQIAVDGGTVTLRGRVHSWQERAAVQGSAWSVPGVTEVVNYLAIDA